MRHTLKAVLLSALVLPGLGQLALGHYKRGGALILVVLASVVAIVVEVTRLALGALAQAGSAGGQPDARAISEAVERVSTEAGSGLVGLLMLLILACWIVAIIDAWRLGRREDGAEREARPG